MCIQNALQQHILDITNDGKDVADFFYATMQGATPNAQVHHQMDAAKQLRKLGIPATPSASSQLVIPAQAGIQRGWDGGEDHDTSIRHSCESRNPEEQGEGTSPPSTSAPVTDLDIINYEVASLIREETNDGYFIAGFLARVMRGDAGQGRPVSDADRMRAAMELMNRGLGRFGDTRDRRISDSQDELIHSGLSRYIRERTDNGLHTARFLLDVASGQEQSFSVHQRVVATRELVRRGWDTNYDAITPEDIAAYHERQDALGPTDYDTRLQEWREQERVAQDEPCEDEPQLEAGIFAHLTNAEVARYEAMSAEEQQEFVERQRQLRVSRRSAEAQPTHQPETTDQPDENSENTDRNTIIQEVSAPSRTPHPVHPVNSQTHIRDP